MTSIAVCIVGVRVGVVCHFCLNEIVECMQVRQCAPNTMCAFESMKKRTYPHYHLERITLFFLYSSFFAVLLLLVLVATVFFLCFNLVFLRVDHDWNERALDNNTKKSQKQQFNEKQKQNDFAHIYYELTHTLTGWLAHTHTHDTHSPSLTYRPVIVAQSMRDCDRQGKEMQSF